MNNHPTHLRLDQPAAYRIQVQGRVDKGWRDYFDGMTVTEEKRAGAPTLTTLTGTVLDQAALQGLLTKLYNLGLPLLAVQCIETDLVICWPRDQKLAF